MGKIIVSNWWFFFFFKYLTLLSKTISPYFRQTIFKESHGDTSFHKLPRSRCIMSLRHRQNYWHSSQRFLLSSQNLSIFINCFILVQLLRTPSPRQKYTLIQISQTHNPHNYSRYKSRSPRCGARRDPNHPMSWFHWFETCKQTSVYGGRVLRMFHNITCNC